MIRITMTLLNLLIKLKPQIDLKDENINIKFV